MTTDLMIQWHNVLLSVKKHVLAATLPDPYFKDMYFDELERKEATSEILNFLTPKLVIMNDEHIPEGTEENDQPKNIHKSNLTVE